MSDIVVIDYGMGNLRSVAKALEHVAPGRRVTVSNEAAHIRKAGRVVFPGQGAIGDCMAELRRLGLVEVVRECAHTRPFLGVCLGLQALMDTSEEDGGTPALGLMPGTVRFFGYHLTEPGTGNALKVPHMGWNQVKQTIDHPLWAGIPDQSRFYFVHSYYVAPSQPEQVAGVTHYGLTFTSVVAQDNIFAVQFHPEKSQQAGLKLLENFARWNGEGVA